VQIADKRVYEEKKNKRQSYNRIPNIKRCLRRKEERDNKRIDRKGGLKWQLTNARNAGKYGMAGLNRIFVRIMAVNWKRL